MIGVDRFGASAPGPVVMSHYGFTVEHVIEAMRPRRNRSHRGSHCPDAGISAWDGIGIFSPMPVGCSPASFLSAVGAPCAAFVVPTNWLP
jgi:hypothetical protein